MNREDLKAGIIITGPLFPEPVKVILVQPIGDNIRFFGSGVTNNTAYDRVLTDDMISLLDGPPAVAPFDGNAKRFRLGIEALRLGLAYEYDPYFSLSIARVDPLPHQLEAVYDYFLKLPRIRFLLADDPGAGKTIMAGLLIKELKIRGLVKRILIITPANLSFQWQRELKDRFREQFEVIKGDVLRANYGSNPWQERNQLITSISWVSTIEDAKESLLRSQWDLIIVDEAHKMSASPERKTLAYQLGEALGQMTDHFLLMTATPHKGNPEHFRLFLELLDKDVYGDIVSLENAIREREAPFYLRRVKEALVNFPDPDTGEVRMIFTRREVRTVDFQITEPEMEFYDALTNYVEDQSIKASPDSPRGRAIGFTMAMLQRRFASSVFAVRRTLERMKERRQLILDDPEAYRQAMIEKQLPDNFDELPEDEQNKILEDLEGCVASLDPADLKEEIIQLERLVALAKQLETSEIESKLAKLKETLTREKVFRDTKTKLLIFTEHKDTLDYLIGKLREWGLTVTQIHGGMKIGNQDTPHTRIYAEKEFRESCQVLVATEAAGEGINLQFCWLMINYDIPWNPVRLEQRMGRIHRYGQERDCLIFNFVSTNTREGRVLKKLFERVRQIEDDLDPNRTGKVFNVLGEIFPAAQLEKMLREMYARNLTEDVIKDRIVKEVDTERFNRITASALESLAKRELNLSAIVGKSSEAKERRLVPEVIEDFFIKAGPEVGLVPKETPARSKLYRIGRIPKNLLAIGEKLEPRFGRLGREYKSSAVFDKLILRDHPTAEWITPGHPLFEVIRESMLETSHTDFQRGAVFYDLHRSSPARLDVYRAEIKDGAGHSLHQKLFVLETDADGQTMVKQPTMFLDLIPSEGPAVLPENHPEKVDGELERILVSDALHALQGTISEQREKEIRIIRRHLELSLNELINRQNVRLMEFQGQLDLDSENSTHNANIKNAEDRLVELNNRLERRMQELDREKICTIGEIRKIGCAWVLPHPKRNDAVISPMVRDPEVERIAVQTVTAYEQAEGREVESVESENRGFDLITRRPHPSDPALASEIRFIEVKGRASEGDIALTSNEYKTAQRLGKDYWLYVVYNCKSSAPQVRIFRDPAKLPSEVVMKVEHYRFDRKTLIQTESQ